MTATSALSVGLIMSPHIWSTVDNGTWTALRSLNTQIRAAAYEPIFSHFDESAILSFRQLRNTLRTYTRAIVTRPYHQTAWIALAKHLKLNLVVLPDSGNFRFWRTKSKGLCPTLVISHNATTGKNYSPLLPDGPFLLIAEGVENMRLGARAPHCSHRFRLIQRIARKANYVVLPCSARFIDRRLRFRAQSWAITRLLGLVPHDDSSPSCTRWRKCLLTCTQIPVPERLQHFACTIVSHKEYMLLEQAWRRLIVNPHSSLPPDPPSIPV